jgi:hypothetical protein
MSLVSPDQLSRSAEFAAPDNYQANIEYLRFAGEVGEALVPVYERAVLLEASLAGIIITDSKDEEDSEFAVGYAHAAGETESQMAEIVIDTSGWSIYERLIAERPTTIEITAAKLGIATADLDASVLASFVFAHELGHVVDWVQNTDSEEALWARRKADMNKLPMPGPSPQRLREFAKEHPEKMDEYFSEHKRELQLKGITNLEQLHEAQEFAYRYIETEDIPDQFAVKVLTAAGVVKGSEI